MLYQAYELQRRASTPLRRASGLTARALGALPAPVPGRPPLRRVRAACEILAHAAPTHTRPAWGIDEVVVGGRPVEVHPRAALRTPFATLRHFDRPAVTGQPRVLLVGPMSGHFTTLLRPTVRTLLADHDVYALDWENARDVPVGHGPFGLDEYVDHVLQALRHLGPDTHVVAVCQPAVPVLAAVALLAADGDPATPPTLTLMAGPVDTRVNPGPVNDLAARRSLASFERWAVQTVPAPAPGAGRRVYPGVTQLSAFMSLDPRRHLKAHLGLYRALVDGDTEAAARTRSFYDEYGAVMDVPAEFYLETLERVFMDQHLATGRYTHRGRPVDPAAITRTALLTVEGGKDEMCPPGQTAAAHDLCTGIPAGRKRHHLQPGVGHYGVFSGSGWTTGIYPVLRSFVASHARTEVAAAR
ncbi:polyhydroxyalkanoate depolymerase [Blastococcus sp. URHD0036]|uniref:polyhydroxyalkanoate depolymerase n=1 Tax=Blastococcus sp. URHD0036 TaxID=1380356 RepID=UPI00049777E8|nr:polyhydroxyalkanoate depolymerase [Blastococcus sp. URHD0036]